jgi:hypothetical protein
MCFDRTGPFPSEKWIQMYEQSRLMTGAGQAQRRSKSYIGEQGGRQAR